MKPSTLPTKPMKRGKVPKKGLRASPRRIQRSTASKKGKKNSKLPKVKVWSLKKADRQFRGVMLKSVPVKCVFPECPITDPAKLTVSHYHGRVNKGTRFDIRNCDFICRNHHYWDKQLGWEFQKQTLEKHGWDGRYTLYMKEKLGADYQNVKELADSGMKPKIAIQTLQATLTTIST